MAGNVGHAWLTVGQSTSRCMAIGWAAAPPALLMLAIHGLPTLARMLGSDRRDTLLTVVVWGVTLGAFGWSALGIFGFTTAMGVPREMAWLAPLVIDLSVFGATRGLVLTAPLAARMRAGRASPTSDSRPQAGAPPLPTMAPPPAAAVPNESAPQQDRPSVAHEARERESAAPRPPAPAPTAVPPAAAAVPEAVPTARARAVAVGAGTAAAPPVRPEIAAKARDIVASGAVRKPVETVAAVLSAAEGETRKAAIAERAGVHHSVVTKILDAADSRDLVDLAEVG